jgi:hypothetical protein
VIAWPQIRILKEEICLNKVFLIKLARKIYIRRIEREEEGTSSPRDVTELLSRYGEQSVFRSTESLEIKNKMGMGKGKSKGYMKL